MYLCPICLKMIDKDRYTINEFSTCPNCKQPLEKISVISTIPFLDCISAVQYVGLNTEEGAKRLLEMMK